MQQREAFTPKRGRPTADQAAAISRTILAAAAERLLADGFEGASMEAIAAAAGVPKSTLYKRYPDKLSLLRAVFEDRVAAWSAVQSQDNWSLPDDLEQRLKRHAETVLVWSSSEEVRAFHRLAAGAWKGAADVARVMREIGYASMVDYLEGEIRTFGGAAVKDPRGVAGALMALLTGWLTNLPPGEGVPPDDARVFAHRAVELLMYGRQAW